MRSLRHRALALSATAWVAGCAGIAAYFSDAALTTVLAKGAAERQSAESALSGDSANSGEFADANESAEAFVARVNRELDVQLRLLNAAGWAQQTYINPDTEYLNAQANERYLEWFSKTVAQARRYDGQALDPRTRRALALLKLNTTAPAPSDPAKRAELSQILTRLDAMYGEGKYCPRGPESCRNLDELSKTIATSRDYAELTEAWTGWHTISRDMRPKYARFVELANEGARELGFADLGAMWRSGYDMPPDAFAAEVERLWGQVKPLYEQLHCYARSRLQTKYGKDKVPDGQPIPAQLLGNMWAQQWNKIYDDLLKPYPQASIESADRELAAQRWDPERMTRSAESFYTSIGFPPLPPTFWKLSMFTRPRDREVVCHAS
ncbi:MAG: M2 family metallopeptidase, partial [Steroidobacteraceae bacterium]|nr:M2 family metallopeptidase [Steroidobacteraceae bacterium]MDW8259247.1 M2 family metallopeptidase [Gammaproteobacteria bacterium]